jgi:hypothetical protein
MDMPSFYLALPIMTPDTAPDLSIKAKPDDWKQFDNATLLYVSKAWYRRATFGGEYFILDPVETAKYKPNSKLKEGWDVAIVFCGWFGTRLSTRGIALRYQVEGSAILTDTSKRVVTNIATPEPYVRKKMPSNALAHQPAEVSSQSS